jgi:microcompartment protein CcmK/EutM
VTSSQDHYQAGHPKVIHVDDSVGTQQCEGCGVGSIACARFQKRFKSRGNNKRRKRCLECVAQQKSPCGQSDDEFIVRNMPNKMVEELRRRCIASDGCIGAGAGESGTACPSDSARALSKSASDAASSWSASASSAAKESASSCACKVNAASRS